MEKRSRYPSTSSLNLYQLQMKNTRTEKAYGAISLKYTLNIYDLKISCIRGRLLCSHIVRLFLPLTYRIMFGIFFFCVSDMLKQEDTQIDSPFN